jgi:hypothetical protein
MPGMLYPIFLSEIAKEGKTGEDRRAELAGEAERKWGEEFSFGAIRAAVSDVLLCSPEQQGRCRDVLDEVSRRFGGLSYLRRAPNREFFSKD